VYTIFAAFANQEQRDEMRQAYADGISWGDAKQKAFELINSELAESRERYNTLVSQPARIEEELLRGAKKARAFAAPFLERIREAIGIRRLG
jgi:tryptophanyl-tRNA synthetase